MHSAAVASAISLQWTRPAAQWVHPCGLKPTWGLVVWPPWIQVDTLWAAMDSQIDAGLTPVAAMGCWDSVSQDGLGSRAGDVRACIEADVLCVCVCVSVWE